MTISSQLLERIDGKQHPNLPRPGTHQIVVAHPIAGFTLNWTQQSDPMSINNVVVSLFRNTTVTQLPETLFQQQGSPYGDFVAASVP
jgi:hypothetical protein